MEKEDGQGDEQFQWLFSVAVRILLSRAAQECGASPCSELSEIFRRDRGGIGRLQARADWLHIVI